MVAGQPAHAAPGGGCDVAGCACSDGICPRRTDCPEHCTARVGNLELANDEVRFNARFGGVPRQVSVPLAAVLAIYARENGAGTMFEPEAAYDEDVASLNDDDATPGAESETVMSVIDGDKPDHDDDNNPDDDPPPPRGGRPALRVVK